MEIKVIGSGCEKYSKLYQNASLAAKQLGIETPIEKVEDLLSIVRLGVMTSPALMVNRKIAAAGRILTVREIQNILKKEEL